ncbi:MAG: tRNA uridine-5-carboxymethylaminomethyl(34) synthesis GTPase MnmE [Candidatus Poribacteria bacterium]|nr:tRNA uridine-5-carboxymethylaminomethyl(34) synthesis GTPase MnmE [Candidatus Poribacteria bacterium]
MILSDTISAIATPNGEGGIGIIRLSGPLAIPISTVLFHPSRQISDIKSYTIHHGQVIDPESNQVVDEVLLNVFRSPKSYTTEDMVEFNCHGGSIILRRVLELTLKHGARIADPGEFTKRAFLNGRIDLAQAEAVIDLIQAKSDIARQMAVDQLGGKLSQTIASINDQIIGLLAETEAMVDFPDEDLDFMDFSKILQSSKEIRLALDELIATANDGRIIREGINCAILGKPNVGKSSLLNALLETDRAIVTEIPGTTRDTIEESVSISGIPLNLIDTAGIRETDNLIEQHGVERSKSFLAEADLLLVVISAADPMDNVDIDLLHSTVDRKAVIILNKIDLPMRTLPVQVKEQVQNKQIIETSVLHSKGVENLKSAILTEVLVSHDVGDPRTSVSTIVTNVRHYDALRRAKADLSCAIDSLCQRQSPEFVALDLRGCLDQLGEIVGKTTNEDILGRIFSQFCVGK